MESTWRRRWSQGGSLKKSLIGRIQWRNAFDDIDAKVDTHSVAAKIDKIDANIEKINGKSGQVET